MNNDRLADPFIQLEGAPAIVSFIVDEFLKTPSFTASIVQAEAQRKRILQEVEKAGLLEGYPLSVKGTYATLAYSRAQGIEDEIIEIRNM